MLINPIDVEYHQERLRDIRREVEKQNAMRKCLPIEEPQEESLGLIQWLRGWRKKIPQRSQSTPKRTSPILR
jgi:hypothetical protein